MPTYDEMLDQALLASSRGKPAERAAVAALAAAYPERPGGPALSALCALWSGRLEEAQALALNLGGDPATEAARGEIEGYAGDPQGLPRIEAALAAAPDDPIVLRCAYSILGIDQPARALAVARRRAELRPHDPAAHAAVGTALLNAAPEEAERLAAEPPPAYAGTHQHETLRARLAMRRRDLPAAEAHARAAVAACSDSYMAWATLADVLRFQGAKEEAERAARFALELNPRNPMPLRVLAWIAAGRGDRAEAARLEAEAQAAIPALAFMASLRKANALAKEGKPESALAELRKLDAFPGAARGAVHAIRTGLLVGMRDDAALKAHVAEMEGEGASGGPYLLARAEMDRREGRLPDARARLETAWREGLGAAAAPLLGLLGGMGDREAMRRVAAEATAAVPGVPADAAMVFVTLDREGLKDEARRFLDAAERRFPEAQGLRLLRTATHAEDGNVARMVESLRGLDAEHRPNVRLRIPLGRLLRLLWRCLRSRRGGPRGGVE